MKIHAIRIKNLASLDGFTEINFNEEPLRSAGIFAITGATGAGKSTILDALCLAIYAKTPRYRFAENGIDIADVKGSTIKQDDVRGILRDGTSDGFAEVDFVGIDKQNYRTNWSVRRARSKADGNLQAYELSLKNISTHQDIPGKKTELLVEIERLVGLNFEQFTRSVLLAQGDFTAFLKAGKDEKSSLLEKLTGTHIYSEISKTTFEHHREHQQILRDLTVRRGEIPTLSSEELFTKQAAKVLLDDKINEGDQQLADLKDKIDWHIKFQQFQTKVNTAQLEFDLAIENKNKSLPRVQDLKQLERIQAVKPDIIQLQNIERQTDSKTKQSKELHKELEGLKIQEESEGYIITATSNELDNKTQEFENAKPQLEKARKLDVQLAEKKEQFTQYNKDLDDIIKKQNDQQTELKNNQQTLEKLNQEIDKYNDWIDTNKARRLIAEQKDLILSKLKDAAGYLQSRQSYSSQIHDSELKIAAQKKKRQQLVEDQSSIQSSIQPIKDLCVTLQNTLAEIPIQEIETETSAIDSIKESTIKADGHWRQLYITIQEKNTLSQLLEQTRKDLSQHQEQLKAATNLVELKKVARDSAAKSLEIAKLAATKSVEQLRQQLEPDTPCPVCGSTEHPYATSHPGIDLMLTELEANYKQSEKEFGEQLKNQIRFSEECNQEEKIISKSELKISDAVQQISALEAQWKTFDIYENSQSIAIEDISKWIDQQLTQQKAKQKRLQQQTAAYYTQKKDLENNKAKQEKLQQELTSTENEIKDIDRALHSLGEGNVKDNEELLKADQKLKDLQLTLSEYFNSENWFEKWQSAPENFINKMQSFSDQWCDYQSKLIEKIKEQHALNATIKELQQQTDHLSNDVQMQKYKRLELQNFLDDLSMQRHIIFKGEPVADVENRFAGALEKLRKELEKKKEEAKIINDKIIDKNSQHKQLATDLVVLSQEKETLTLALKNWIDHQNSQYKTSLTEAELFRLQQVTAEWIENERTQLHNIERAVTEAKSILDDRSLSLSNHNQNKTSDSRLEELSILYDDLKKNISDLRREVHEIEFAITSDQNNKLKIGDLQHTIDNQSLVVDNWGKLNEIIGSADGKKFRQIAQEYTLDVLLSFANIHLEDLSKRYMLQRIPDSLGLQVVDQDMGDEVRTVYSLSGGESFLVSLALALGLASLSSNRMKVESLFIDEGFGSLDPTTLNIAMDALERLHNQGRKVGVISHVQEMTERISVQIKVSKQQSGRSKVEVIG